MRDESNARSLHRLVECCRHGDDDERVAALLELRDLGCAQALPAILPLSSAPDAFVRSAAADALGTLGHGAVDEVGPVLVRMLEDPEEHVRTSSAEALALLRYRGARPALERMLCADESWVARASAAEALGELGESDALGPLQAALGDEYYPVRGYAAYAIGQLGGPGQLPIIRQCLDREHHPGPRSALLATALRFGDEAAFDGLLALMAEVDDEFAHHVFGAVEDLLAHDTPLVVTRRARELAAALRAVGATELAARSTDSTDA